MKLNLITFNDRGMNDDTSISLLKNYISSIPNLDILLLQEHKLYNQTTEKLGRTLWCQATTWTLEASPGYGNDPLVLGAGKVGIASLLSPKLAPLISRQGVILDNRCHYFILSGLLAGDIGIVNVNAPNEPPLRCQLWEQMTLHLPSPCRWIIASDFNMVKLH